MDANLDFALTRRRDFKLLDLQDFRATGLVKSHDFGHAILLVSAVRLGISYRHCR